jgi:hypothetical protein
MLERRDAFPDAALSRLAAVGQLKRSASAGGRSSAATARDGGHVNLVAL